MGNENAKGAVQPAAEQIAPSPGGDPKRSTKGFSQQKPSGESPQQPAKCPASQKLTSKKAPRHCGPKQRSANPSCDMRSENDMIFDSVYEMQRGLPLFPLSSA